MDSVYPPKQYRASEVLDLKEYFTEYSHVKQKVVKVAADEHKKSKNERIRNILQTFGIEMETSELKKLENICSVDHLTCKDENKNLPMDVPKNIHAKLKLHYTHPVTEEAKKLHVVQTALNYNAELLSLENYFGFKRSFQSLEGQSSSSTADLTPGSDYILLLLIYKPKKYFQQRPSLSNKPQFSHSIEVLGNNSLEQLRDVIACASDTGTCKEVYSPDDDLTELRNAKEKYPSGFFFINNIFYNDFRHKNAIDYSKVILEWASTKGLDGMTTTSMKDKKVCDTKLRMGYPYVYMHQGDCEHVMVFSDAKLLQKFDELDSEKYPRISTFTKYSVRQQCYLCSLVGADWICQESDRFPQERIFLCTGCCKSYNYVDGKKVNDFKLYPHFYESII